MNTALHLRLQETASGLRLIVRGRLRADTARQLGQAVSMALHRLGAARLTLDLAAVDEIDAAGVAALIHSRIEADRCNVILTITGPTPHVADAMRSHAMPAAAGSGAPTGHTGVLAVVLPFRTRAAAACRRSRRRHDPHPQQ